MNRHTPILPAPREPRPPAAKQRASSREIHNTTIEDPYAWLRDPGYPKVSDPDILAYLEAENAYFEAVMTPHRGLTKRIFEELKGRLKPDDESVPVKDGGWLYQWRYEDGAQYRRWYRKPAEGSGDWRLVLDEPALAAACDYFRLGGLSVSPDGRYLAYALDTDGSERFTLRIRDLERGVDLEDIIENTIGSPVWAADSTILIYHRVNENWRPYAARAHRLGQAAEEDVTLYEERDGGFFVHLGRTQSRAWIVISAGSHTTSEVRLVPASDPFAEPLLISPREDGHEYEIDHAAGRFFIRSNWQAQNFRILTAEETAPERAQWRELIGASERDYFRGITAFEEFLVIEQRRDGLDQIRIRRHADGAEHFVAFPEAAYRAELGTNPEYDVNRIRIGYDSMITPATVFDYDIEARELITRKVQEIPSGYDREAYETERLMAPARDGAQVPVSIVYRKGFKEAAPGPVHLYGYGAYGLGMPPGFSTSRLSLLDRGFAYAIAHIRGGDELGRGWYEAGKGAQRMNAFADFIDAGEYLIAKGYARAGGISASGGSAGGKLMGAVANLRPELWRAIVAHVPFVDVLNTMLDDSLPLTPIEWPEWGNPIESAEAFRTIRAYSPYDNVRAQAYPPMLVTCGLNDPRVTYWEPAKWVAKLRATKTDDNLLLLKTNMGAGHAGRSGRYEALWETAEAYTFLLMAFAMAGDGK